MTKYFLVFLSSVLLSGCLAGFSDGSDNDAISQETQELLEQVETTSVDLENTDAWSRFSFPKFSIALPSIWQAVKINNEDGIYELANYQENNEGDPDGIVPSEGNLKLIVSPVAGINSLDDVNTSGKTKQMSVAGKKSLKVDDESDGFVVYAQTQEEGGVYMFDFQGDFQEAERLSSLMLSTVKFK